MSRSAGRGEAAVGSPQPEPEPEAAGTEEHAARDAGDDGVVADSPLPDLFGVGVDKPTADAILRNRVPHARCVPIALRTVAVRPRVPSGTDTRHSCEQRHGLLTGLTGSPPSTWRHRRRGSLRTTRWDCCWMMRVARWLLTSRLLHTGTSMQLPRVRRLRRDDSFRTCRSDPDACGAQVRAGQGSWCLRGQPTRQHCDVRRRGRR